jgi:hypothetical protein
MKAGGDVVTGDDTPDSRQAEHRGQPGRLNTADSPAG